MLPHSLFEYFIFIILGLAPSTIWLLFYLRKDAHPEPNGTILKVFFLGMLATLPAIFLERELWKPFEAIFHPPLLAFILYIILGIALVEEILKYIVVRFFVFSKSVIDEPIDLMLYMIISALGFAGFENILYIFRLEPIPTVETAFGLTIVRFVGAVFLHALVSAVWGYFLALSCTSAKAKKLYFLIGAFLAVFLHSLFDIYILVLRDKESEEILLLLPTAALFALAVCISLAIGKLKQMKGVCKI